MQHLNPTLATVDWVNIWSAVSASIAAVLAALLHRKTP
jgi:hypothetical protein